jgi:acetyl esterase/lipase
MAYAKMPILLAAVVVFVVSVAACSPLTAINALSPGGASRETADLSYGPDPRNRLDIYTPREGASPAPVVVFFYGGNWTSGERADYAFVGRALASRGIVAVIADYRLYPAVHYPEILQDSARAVAWTLREAGRYGGDPRRVFVMGHSAGAYNAAMVALDDRWLAPYGVKPAALRGWIGLAGPYDFLPIGNRTVRPVFFFPETPADSQPANHVGAAAPPALLIAARNDTLVDPLRNTGGLARRLRAAGVHVDERYFDGVSHATLVASIAAPLRGLAPTLDAISSFVLSDGERETAPAAQQAAAP